MELSEIYDAGRMEYRLRLECWYLVLLKICNVERSMVVECERMEWL